VGVKSGGESAHVERTLRSTSFAEKRLRGQRRKRGIKGEGVRRYKNP